MKTHSHTPGPWCYTLGRGANPRFHIQTTAGYQIASTPELSKHRMAAEENAGKEANARLIAAAPELLNMLQRMVDETGGGSSPCLLTSEHARAAIAKAKGEAQ